MYYLAIRRAVRTIHQVSGEFAPRDSMRLHWEIAGPFPRTLETYRAMIVVLSTPSCQTAWVVSRQELEDIASATHRSPLTDDLRAAANTALQYTGAAAKNGDGDVIDGDRVDPPPILS